MKKFQTVAALAFLILSVSPASSSRKQDTIFAPGNTKVAILPAVDGTGMKDEKASARQCKSINSELVKLFQVRGFKFIPRSDIEAAIKNLGIDFSDEEQRKRATMFSVGKEVHADLVVFVLATDLAQTRSTFGAYDAEPCVLKIWVLDVHHESPIMSAKSQSGGNFPAAVNTVLKDFLKPYAIVPKDQQEVVKDGNR